MARISGITIPDNKKIKIALTYLYGLGNNTSLIVLNTANVDPEKRTRDLSAEEVNKIQNIIEKNYRIEGDLRRDITNNIKRLKEINAWRGTRHAKNLPIHGRTKTNSRTTRGNARRTMGSGKKPTSQKT